MAIFPMQSVVVECAQSSDFYTYTACVDQARVWAKSNNRSGVKSGQNLECTDFSDCHTGHLLTEQFKQLIKVLVIWQCYRNTNPIPLVAFNRI